MESRFQTSFIPKKSVVSEPMRGPRVINLFAVLSTVIFLMVLAGAVGTFFYGSYLEKAIAANKTLLENEKGSLDPELVRQIVRLDTRMQVGQKLINEHIAPSHFFDLLEEITLPSVRFSSFKFDFLDRDKVSLVMKGQASGFSAVALQSDIFNKTSVLQNPIVGSLALQPAGTVSFDFSAELDSTILLFKRYIVGSGSGSDSFPSSNSDMTSSTTEQSLLDTTDSLNGITNEIDSITNGL
jgi:hypothetical protein